MCPIYVMQVFAREQKNETNETIRGFFFLHPPLLWFLRDRRSHPASRQVLRRALRLVLALLPAPNGVGIYPVRLKSTLIHHNHWEHRHAFLAPLAYHPVATCANMWGRVKYFVFGGGIALIPGTPMFYRTYRHLIFFARHVSC